MLDFEEARRRILALAQPAGSERVAAAQAVGRTLAENIVARRALPSAATSAMDGYALRAADFHGASAFQCDVLGESRAGQPLANLAPGTACRIFTGALLPAGADCVVIQENVRRDGAHIEFDAPPRAGDHVRQRGEDLAEGAVVLERGRRLTPFGIGLLAAVERQDVLVGVRPRVAILCTGDELYRPGAGLPDSDEQLRHGIPESNGVALAALVAAVGGRPELLSPVGDDPALIADALGPALDRCDVVFTVGGVSVGDHDRVREALALTGAEVDFWKVSIKPGKPLTVATRGRCRVLGLPGNPVSAQVTFCLFGAPLLRRMQGDAAAVPAFRSATLAAPLQQKPGRTGFYRVRVEGDQAFPLGNQSSGSAVSLALADALAVVPAESSGLAAGERVQLLNLGDI
jgi:molybdopterin molybdotransferase